MRLDITYGKKKTPVNLPEKTKVIYPNKVEARDERETLLSALQNPSGKESLDEFLSGEEEILFVVNDATRPTPTSRILDVLYPKIKEKKVKFIVACGSHRAPTSGEYEFIFGKYYAMFKDSIHAHDARNDPMVYRGKTSRGTEIHVNKIFADAQKIVVINSVEPHYFAGYTGGRKSILPGVSSYRTIEQNHRFALQPSSRTLALEGNPVSEDMEEVASHVKKNIFSIMTVLDSDNCVYAACCGDLNASFRESIKFADEICVVKIESKADIVIVSVPSPMNINLYQSQKALENGKLALKEDGIIILISECSDGVGPREFFELLSSGKTPGEALKKIEKGYLLGYHKAAKLAELLSWAQVWAITSIPDSEIRKAFMKPYPDIQKAIDDALAAKKNAEVLVLMEGSMTVPIV